MWPWLCSAWLFALGGSPSSQGSSSLILELGRRGTRAEAEIARTCAAPGAWEGLGSCRLAAPFLRAGQMGSGEASGMGVGAVPAFIPARLGSGLCPLQPPRLWRGTGGGVQRRAQGAPACLPCPVHGAHALPIVRLQPELPPTPRSWAVGAKVRLVSSLSQWGGELHDSICLSLSLD